MEQVVREAGTRAGCSAEEVERAVRLLDDHWVATLHDWHRLGPHLQRELGLPAHLAAALHLHPAIDPHSANPTQPLHHPPQPSSVTAAAAAAAATIATTATPPVPKPTSATTSTTSTASSTRRGRKNSCSTKSTAGGRCRHPACSIEEMTWAYCLDMGLSVCCEIDGRLLELESNEPLGKLLRQLGQDTHCYTDQWCSHEIHPSTPVKYALIPGRVLALAPHRQYLLKPYGSSRAVDGWLVSLDMGHHRELFEAKGVDDFLVLPYLRSNILEDMGIASTADRNVIMRAVKRMQDFNELQFVGLWLRHLGLGVYEEAFRRHGVGLRTVAILKESDFVRMGLNPTRTALFLHATKYYREFSSAEATFAWLRWSGLGRYAYQFARYQVPFYALPLVNFFIIDEMGVTNQDKGLLSALQALKFSPTYAVKAMAYWLRDLELEEYSLVFSKSLMVDFIESLTILNDHTINRLITCNAAREKMKLAVREMKEVQFYYSASASLLQDLVLQKYADVFAKHNISIDSLPLLDDAGLLEMGFTDQADRESILASVKKIKAELPSGALRLFYSNEPNLYQVDHKEVSSAQRAPVQPAPALDRVPLRTSHQHRPEDTRSVEELLSFINGDSSVAASKHHHFSSPTHPAVSNASASLSLNRPTYGFGSSPLSGVGLGSPSAFSAGASSFGLGPISAPSSSPPVLETATPQSTRPSKKARQRARRKLSLNPEPSAPVETETSSSPTEAPPSPKTKIGNAGKPPAPVPSSSRQARKTASKTNTKSKPTVKDELKSKNQLSSEKLSKEASSQKADNAALKSTTAKQAKQQSSTELPTPGNEDDAYADDFMDPALEAQIDREVEEFRRRLESHSASLDSVQRRPIPSSLRATLAHFNPHHLKAHAAD